MAMCCITKGWKLTGNIISAVAIICLAWGVISVLYNSAKRNKLIVVGFAVVYLFGIIVYQGIIPEKKNDYNNPSIIEESIPESVVPILAPINNALSVFFPSRGSYVENNESHFKLSYQLFHLLSYFFFAMIAFSLFGRRQLNRSRHNLIRYSHKNLFWGFSDNGKIMAESILNHTVHNEVIFVLPQDLRYNEEEDNRTFDEINNLNAIALYADYEKINLQKNRFSGYRHFFMTEEQDFNVRMALKVLDELALKTSSHKTHLYIRSEQENIDIFFEKKLKKLNKELVEIHIYNHSDLAARQFVSENPIIQHNAVEIDTTSCTVEGYVNILLLGFGWMGNELLKKMVCDAQFIGNNFRCSITVIDKDYEMKHGRVKYLTDGINSQLRETGSRCYVEINPNDICIVNGVKFYNWLNDDKRILNFNRIIVALGDDELNVNTALELNRFRLSYFSKTNQDLKYEKIFAHVNNYDKYNYYAGTESPITLFGGLRKTNCFEVLIDECLDRIAKVVNYVYSQYNVEQVTEKEIENASTEIEREWAGTSVFNQNSSRAVALNINNMISIAGGEREFADKLKEERFLELFAEYEHLRWNAFHLVNGIRKWEMDKVTTSNGKLYFIGNSKLMRHICLVRYNELDTISTKVNSLRNYDANQVNYKNSDRRIVRHFPIISNYKIESKKI